MWVGVSLQDGRLCYVHMLKRSKLDKKYHSDERVGVIDIPEKREQQTCLYSMAVIYPRSVFPPLTPCISSSRCKETCVGWLGELSSTLRPCQSDRKWWWRDMKMLACWKAYALNPSPSAEDEDGASFNDALEDQSEDFHLKNSSVCHISSFSNWTSSSQRLLRA